MELIDKEFELEIVTEDGPEKKLECPFTWQMESLVQSYDQETFVNVNDQPIKALMHAVTLVYVYAVKKYLIAAYAKVMEINNLWTSMDIRELEKEGMSVVVLVHIIKATKYHYYKQRGNFAEALKVMDEIPVLDKQQLSNKIINATLNACKSLSWSVFFDAPKSISIAYASRAVQYNPDCALWHFILAKNLRHMRRDDFNYKPLPDEFKHMLKSYELSKNYYFGVYVAQMYWESEDYEKAKKISMEIYNSNPQSVGIRLRLALSFIRSKNYVYAKKCLDFVQIICTDNSMYLHYKGIYYEKQKNYQMAAMYFNKAAEHGNYKADLQYASCMQRINKNFNYIQHLDNMLTKYSKSRILTQQIFLHTAMQFYFRRIDLRQALIYFLKAIQIHPKSKQLKNFKNITVDYKNYNIIDFIYNEEIPKIHQQYVELPYNLSDVVEAIEKLYPLCTNDDNVLSSHVENMDLT